MTLIGIEGCRGGWAIARSNSEFAPVQFDIVSDVATVFSENAIIAIDIPIGLPTSGPRACDLQPRRLLGPKQGSRVFPAPSRATLDGCSYVECCNLNRTTSAVAISKQTYAIIPKILQVDRAITPALQTKVREAHPEVTFRLLKGSPLLHSKKTAGRDERFAILDAHGVGFDPVSERLRLGRSKVAIDDLIDAAVCLVMRALTSTSSPNSR